MSNKLTIADLVKQASANIEDTGAALMKTAHAQGVEDANRVIKVASYTGDIVGNQAYETFHGRVAASLGFNPEEEIVKQASIYDMLECTFEKIAETYSPQTGGANLETTQAAGADQLREVGKSHALLAVQAANDALASIDQGDANTAIQSMNTASQNITLAQQANQVVADPELQAQVAEASQVVGQVASAIQGMA